MVLHRARYYRPLTHRRPGLTTTSNCFRQQPTAMRRRVHWRITESGTKRKPNQCIIAVTPFCTVVRLRPLPNPACPSSAQVSQGDNPGGGDHFTYSTVVRYVVRYTPLVSTAPEGSASTARKGHTKGTPRRCLRLTFFSPLFQRSSFFALSC